MNSYGLMGSLTAKDGKGPELAGILLQAAEILATTAGCYQYIVAQDSAIPERIWITEIWSSKQAHADSLKLDNIRELIRGAMPLIAEPPVPGIETKPLGGVSTKIDFTANHI